MKKYIAGKIHFKNYMLISNILFDNNISEDLNINEINNFLFDIFRKNNIIDKDGYIDIIFGNNGYPDYTLYKIIDKLGVVDIYSPLLENFYDNGGDNIFGGTYDFDTYPVLVSNLKDVHIVTE